MTDDRLASIREDLDLLRRRFARGEIDEATYGRVRGKLLEDLTETERESLRSGSSTPQLKSPSPSTPSPSTPSNLGPSGGSASGLRTSVPTLADLELGPGTVLLGQWRLERELGRGGFGAVFEAEELHLHEKQAVKVLDPGMVAREDLIARFRREVSLMRKLVHPRIVRVYDYREDLPQLIALISMELVTGGSVKQLLTTARAKNIEIPIPLALEILRQTLEALAEAHSDGVIHRDVTPGNVLLAGGSPEELLAKPSLDPKVKLVDFGIAGLVERSELSQRSRVLGTAAYVAPEILSPSLEVTPAADVYGAGAIAYQLLTGELPLGRFAEPRGLRRTIPGGVSDCVLELLEARPGARPNAATAASKVQVLEIQARAELERERLEAERQGQEAERRRLEALARQQVAAQGEAGRQRQEAERERQATIRRVEAEAAAWTQPGGGRKKALSRAIVGVTAAAVAAVLVALGWGISSQRPAESSASSRTRGTWRDERTKLLWTARDNGAHIEWGRAKSYCASLALGGFSDWRLPSLSELQGLYEGKGSLVQPHAVTMTSQWVWSADPDSENSSAGWLFDFGRGERFRNPLANYGDTSRALCVRRSDP